MELNVRWQKFATLFANMMFGSWYLLVGGLLATHLPISQVILALFVGNCIASLLFYFVGSIGFEVRKPTYEIVKPAFGEYGARFIITVLLVIARIGWVAVRAQLGGFALATLLGISPVFGIILFTGVLVLATTQSFKNISIYGSIALFGTVLLSAFGLYAVFQHSNMTALFAYSPSVKYSFWQAINLILISKISFGVIVPDFFQKAKSKRHVFWGSVAGFLPAGLIAGTIGAVLTVATGTYDLVAVLRQLNLPILAYLFLAVSSFAPATLYPTGLGISSIVNKNTDLVKRIGLVIAGCIGMGIAFFGIVQRLTNFLNFLGIAFAPIVGVLFAEYLDHRMVHTIRRFNISGIVSWAVGDCVVFLTSEIFPWGVASINGLIVSFLLYAALIRPLPPLHRIFHRRIR